MELFDKEKHWENIYKTKELNEVSWFQPTPITTLQFIKELNIPNTAKIIDIGGGDSFLVDHLLDLGYLNITVLDISDAALNRAKKRLGDRSNNVTWIVADAANYKATEKYDFWHDRAAFHFLTEDVDIQNYTKNLENNLNYGGKALFGTFSEDGPKKCSGIEIKQYSETNLINQFKKSFHKINCITTNHKTPFNTEQNFTFCSFKKI